MHYDKVYTAGWKDAMEEMEGKLAEERRKTEEMRAIVLMLLDKRESEENRTLSVAGWATIK